MVTDEKLLFLIAFGLFVLQDQPFLQHDILQEQSYNPQETQLVDPSVPVGAPFPPDGVAGTAGFPPDGVAGTAFPPDGVLPQQRPPVFPDEPVPFVNGGGEHQEDSFPEPQRHFAEPGQVPLVPDGRPCGPLVEPNHVDQFPMEDHQQSFPMQERTPCPQFPPEQPFNPRPFPQDQPFPQRQQFNHIQQV